MSVIINLKEIFAADSQIDISSKVNFNFNQLIALGIGQTGPIGPDGLEGPAGPIGPDGPAGPVGSIIFGETPTSITPPISPPSGMRVDDLLITSDSILKKVDIDPLIPATATGWEKLTDFNSLVLSALGSNVSPYVQLTGNSRIIKPRITSGLDLTNASSPAPNYQTPGLGVNYQTVLYNFNELKTSSVIMNGSGNIVLATNGSSTVPFDSTSGGVNLITNVITAASISGHGLANKQYITYSSESGSVIGGLTNYAGYYVLYIDAYTFKLCDTELDVDNANPKDLTSYGTGTHILITYPSTAEKIFPATANLSIYSVFGNDATLAKEFATSSKGYRSQLELGSVDTLPTAYDINGTITSANYVISPSFENLKVKKYRVGSYSANEDYPGTYYLRAEYDLSSAGGTTAEAFSPRRNSEQIWKINKIEGTHDSGQTFELKLTTSNLLAVNESSSGVTVDGLFLKRGTLDGGGGSGYIGFGFDPSDVTKAKVDASSDITTVSFNGVAIELKKGSDFATFEIDTIIFDGDPCLLITAPFSTVTNIAGASYETVNYTKNVITTGNSTQTASNGNIQLTASNAAKFIALNNAIKVKADRLAQGIPFPVTQVLSSDANTLDDYEEGTSINPLKILRYYPNPAPGAPIGSYITGLVNCDGIASFVTSQSFSYTKIGQVVSINADITLNLNYWPADGEEVYPFGPTWTYSGIGVSLPFACNSSGVNLSIMIYDESTVPPLVPSILLSINNTYMNYTGHAIAGTDATLAYIYLYTPNTIPADNSTIIPTQSNRFTLLDSASRSPYDDLGAGEYSSAAVIKISGSYTVA